MNIKTIDEIALFKALSEEIRFRIVLLLSNGELCVCDLTTVLQLPQSTISRHMAKLKAIQLVTDRREGKWVHYKLSDSLKEALPNLCMTIESFAQKEPYLNDLKLYQKHKSENNC